MPIFFHAFPIPLWLIGVIALLSLISDIVIIYGVVFLITRWRVLTRDLRVVIAVIPLLTLTVASFLGAVATVPFGLFGGLPALFIFDSGGFSTNVFLVVAGCLLNTAGFLGIFGFIFNRISRRPRIS